MNTRLQNLYSSIERDSKDKFLNNNIGIATKWGNPIWGITLQIDLEQPVRRILEKYQEVLEEMEPQNLWAIPDKSQHISFNQVVFWGGEYARGAKETWDAIRDVFLKKFREQNKKYRSFKVTFSKLIAASEGIIWCANDEHDEMQNLRETLLAKLPFPAETHKHNHSVHTTVVRYRNKLNNPQGILEWINDQTLSADMVVRRIFLKNELTFPSIETKELAQIDLQ